MIVEDLSKHPTLSWVGGILATAKGIAEKEALMPMLFCKKGDEAIAIVPASQFGTMGDDDEKEQLAFWMRRFLRELGATASAFLTDAWTTNTEGVDPKEIDDAIAKYGNASQWPADLLSRVRRREAITVLVEEGNGTWMLTQFYGRKGKKISFEECLVVEADDGRGRFSNLLPKSRSV
jgi:hypothetical protein